MPVAYEGNGTIAPVAGSESVRPSIHPSTNRLIGLLPVEHVQSVSPHLTPLSMTRGQKLYSHGETHSHVYFPCSGLCSLTRAMEDGSVVEVAVVGVEGFLGVGVVLGTAKAIGEARACVAGQTVLAMPLSAFEQHMNECAAFYRAVRLYCEAFVETIAQRAACNALHSAEARCCRWLLTAHDHVRRDEVPVTQEMLASALGLRRPTVTLAIGSLTRAGIVAPTRGHVFILDRIGLEYRSCECYGILKEAFERRLS